jgi:gliding motility-associated-like protein
MLLLKKMKLPEVLFGLFGLLAFIVSGQAPGCTQLTTPADGATNVDEAIGFEWDPATGATEYSINVGTSPGSTDILDNEYVGIDTFYDLPDDLPSLRTIYVTIVPSNAGQRNEGCTETSFTTKGDIPPRCTDIINPFNGDDLVSTTANITWIRDFTATGYLMTVYEKDPNGILIWDRVDVGNGTNAKPPDFKPRTRYYITIIPYNDFGPAVGCEAITFTTGDAPPLPNCAQLTSPANGAVEVPIDTDLEWSAVRDIEGYLVTIGTVPRGNDILDRFDAGTDTRLELRNSLPLGTRIYVLITAYINGKESDGCAISSFFTEGPSSEMLEGMIPSFFTPNNDGINDSWMVDSAEDIVVEEIMVFDRYGTMLQQLQPGEGWNGTYQGRALPSGSYWYRVQLASLPALKGYFLLKR